MKENFSTPIQKRPKSGIHPYQSPLMKDANFIRKIAHSKENEKKRKKKKLFFLIIGFIFYFFLLNMSFTK